MRRHFTLIVLLFAGVIIATGFINPRFIANAFSPETTFNFPLLIKEDYDKLWKRVDSATNKGLPQTALKVVEQIYNKAKAENNAPQFVKAVIHKMKFWSHREEFSLEKSINELRAETETAKFPVKPVLHSILADAYWQYYSSNRWKFYNRTNTVNFKKDDVSTWTLTDIVNAAVKHYVASVQNSEELKKTKVDVYDEIIIDGSTENRKYRPTLYDFLAHRAIGFFRNTQAEINRPANQFHINDEIWLKPYNDFMNAKLSESEDSLNLRYYAVKLLQDLARFHADDKQIEAKTDLDLIRLSFIHSVSNNANKDSLYLNSLRSLAKQIAPDKMTAEVYFHVADFYEKKAASYDPLKETPDNEHYKWLHKKAYDICKWTIEQYKNTSGATYCQSMIRAIEAPTVNLAIENVNEPAKPFRALVTYRNIPKLFVRIIKLDYNRAYDDELYNLYGEKLIKKLVGMEAIKKFSQDLPTDGDFMTHRTEIKMPELPAGYYLVLTSTREDFNLKESIFEHARFWNSNIAWITRNLQNGTQEFFVVDRISGRPLPNVTLQSWYSHYDYGKRKYVNRKGESKISDANGTASFSIAEKEKNYYFNVEFINGDDRIFSGNFSLYRYEEHDYTPDRAFIFLDRAIYRPGQAIYFKGIHISGNKKDPRLLTGQRYTYTLYDVNYQKVSSLELTTNEYGTVSGTFTAPMGVLNGQMHITCGTGTQYFRVEEYKRPKFETEFAPLKGAYRLEDTVTVNGVAKAYAGYAIDGAEVKYRVARTIRYPYWWYWWYRETPGSQTEIINGVLKTNDTGGYVIKFQALPDPAVSKKSSPYYTYTIYADVTDINGETRSTSTSVTVGYKMLEMNLSMPQKIERSKADSVSVFITNLNGVEEPTAGTYVIYRLKQPDKIFRERLWERPDKFTMSKDEYYAAFPFDQYSDEMNMTKWEKETKVMDGAFNTAKLKKFSIKNLANEKSGAYVVEAYCKDKYGEEVKDIRFFTLYSSSDEGAPIKSISWYEDVKSKGEPGENASFIQASSYKDINYIFSVEHDGKLLSTETKSVSMREVVIPIKEEYRGNFAYSLAFIKNNRCFNHKTVVTVPYTNKELDIQFETFRDKLLPGQQEEWKVVIRDKKKEKQTAEMVAAMYDASLDAFAANYWNFNVYTHYYSRFSFQTECAQRLNASQYSYNGRYYYYSQPYRYYDRLNYFGLSFYSYNYRYDYDYMADGGFEREENNMPMAGVAADVMEEKEVTTKSALKKSESDERSKGDKNMEMQDEVAQLITETTTAATGKAGGETDGKDLGDVKARSNFNETSFFYPQLQTNEKGEIIIKFTVPESLTKWKVMGFAHTKDLKHGMITKEVITQKELMVQPNAPRFFREGDKMSFPVKIANLSDKKLEGTAEIKFTDPVSGKDITSQLLKSSAQQSFTTVKGQSAPLMWEIEIPFGIQTAAYRVVAKAGNFSDGEEAPMPVLTNRMLVTESMPLPIRSNQTKTWNFEKFMNQNNGSTTLVNHKYTLEFTANPAWYAIQALPYLMEYPYECSEQTFARFYANSISSHIANSKPKIKAVFDAWKSSSPEAFMSNLEKNQELKSLLLEETPWVLDAKDESERKKRVGLLFDLNKMSNELARAQSKLLKMQAPNGGWPWFEGMPDDWYITQHIVTGFGHLDKLGIKKIREDHQLWSAIQKAVLYCDDRLREEYEEIKRWDKDWEKNDHLGYMAIQFIYARSYFRDIQMQGRNKKAFDYFMGQAKKYWLAKGRYMDGMLALGLHRYEDKKTPMDIMRSIKEHALNSEEMGMYWKENYEGFYWYEAPIEAHALMIEAFDEVAKDAKAVDDLKVWLLKSKQTQNWHSTKATTEAVYALLLRGTDWLATEPNVTIDLGEIKIDPKNDKEIKTEAGTGYFKKSWSGSDIKPSMGKVTVKKSDEGVSWGAVYWQYFENLDKITPHKTPLQLNKKLFIVENTKAGEVLKPIDSNTKLKPGDKIKCRIELRVDRDMQYVHMKDMRAAGFEPTNVLSGYRWQDGLGYYESTRDAATNFFFSYLNKGTYVFEYPMVVSHYGDFSNGITTIQCMYAPEFTSHSEGIRVKVVK